MASPAAPYSTATYGSPGYNPATQNPVAQGEAPGMHGGQMTGAGRALLNVLTLGAYDHPAQAGAYWKGVAQSLNPTTRDGAIGLASILVPGKLSKSGIPGPTAGQHEFLQTIHDTSKGVPPADSIYQPNYQDPTVQALMQHLGAPGGYHPNPILSGEMNPLIDLFHQNMNRPTGLGLHPDTYEGPIGGPSDLGGFSGGDRLQKIMQIIAKNNINRRN